MSDALTQKDSMSRLMVEPVQAVRLFGSEVRQCFLSRDGDRKISREACESTLARKGANANCKGARTANRRRWARRES